MHFRLGFISSFLASFHAYKGKINIIETTANYCLHASDSCILLPTDVVIPVFPTVQSGMQGPGVRPRY